MHDAVVTINDTHWPAYRKENGTLVDLVAQRHQQVLIAEAVKHDHFGDRSREQFHRNGIGPQTLDVLSEVLVIDADVPGFSRNTSMLQSDPVCCAIVF